MRAWLRPALSRSWLGYPVALLLVLTAILLRILFLPALMERFPYITFYPAIVLAATFGGFIPGLLATVLSVLASSYWLFPPGELFVIRDSADWLSMVVFLLTGMLISWACSAWPGAIARGREAELLASIIAERKDSEERMRLFVEHTPAAVAMFDRHMTYMAVSRRWLTDYKLGDQNIIGRTHYEVFPGLPERWKAVHRRCLAGAVEKSTEDSFIREDGRVEWVRWEIHPWREASGEIGGIIMFSEVITERKQMEESLLKTRDLLRLICDATPDPIFVKNCDSSFLLANPATLRAMGKKSEDVIGKTDLEIYSNPEIAKGVMENDRKVIQTGITQVMEELVETPEGPKIFLSTKTPFLNKEGGIIGVIGVCRDITERKKEEEERRLFEATLQQTHKLDSIGILAGGIAHDFNNLLTSMYGYLGLGLENCEKGLFGKVHECLDKAVSSLGRAKDLTNQLLTFSKGGEPMKHTINLSSLVRETVSFALSGSNIRADLHVSEDLWTCEADENQLIQALDNIVRNAREAMPEGGVVKVTAENLGPGEKGPPGLSAQNLIRISIEDQGLGIAPENIEHIFDPFFTTKERGHGLGLSIAYSIIRKHEGTISVQSHPGSGSVFSIYLPASGKFPVVEAEKPDATAESARILLMDDDEPVAEVSKQILGSLGYSVETAHDGEEALVLYRNALAGNAPFDVVILDLTIRGGMGGKTTLQELLKINPSVKTIVSSGYADDPVMADPEGAGFTAALAKPYRLSEMKVVLHKVLHEDLK